MDRNKCQENAIVPCPVKYCDPRLRQITNLQDKDLCSAVPCPVHNSLWPKANARIRKANCCPCCNMELQSGLAWQTYLKVWAQSLRPKGNYGSGIATCGVLPCVCFPPLPVHFFLPPLYRQSPSSKTLIEVATANEFNKKFTSGTLDTLQHSEQSRGSNAE